MPNDLPAVPLNLTLHPSLRALATRDDLPAMLGSRLQHLLDGLGVPGRAEVQVRVAAPPAGTVWATVSVNGRTCGAPAPVVTRIRQLIDAEPAAPVGEHDRRMPTVQWLTRLLADPSPDGGDRVSRFCALVVHAVLTRHLGTLLGDEQAAAYAQRLPQEAAPQEIAAAVRPALDAKLSIADSAVVGEALGDADKRTSWLAAEPLITRLHPDEVTVHLSGEYLRELTRRAGQEGAGLLAYLRHGLLEEVGILVPPR